jgi:hypothetical protein
MKSLNVIVVSNRPRPFFLAERYGGMAMDSVMKSITLNPGVNADVPREFFERFLNDPTLPLRKDPNYSDLYFLD